MISNQVIQTTIDDLKQITKVDFQVFDVNCVRIATTNESTNYEVGVVKGFIESSAESQVVAGSNFLKVMEDGDVRYILIASGETEMAYTMAKVAVTQLQSLLVAYQERVDHSSFFQNLILDNLLLVDIHNKAQKLHIENEKKRIVYVIETGNCKDGVCLQLLKSLYVPQAGNYIVSVDEQSIILIKDIDEKANDDTILEIADNIVNLMNTEAMIDVRVAYGLPVKELKDISKSYKEAKMALDVGNIFYSGMKTLSYENLGIGRLIYQLPISLCELFVKEVFGDTSPDDIDEETLSTVYKFFENNLNVSETSRQLYIHRNTLVYRMEKLQKMIGLDMRVFDDALTFKIAMMVVEYINYVHSNE